MIIKVRENKNMENNNKITSNEMGYTIEVSDKSNVMGIYKVYMPDGSLVANIDSISDLVQNKYLSASKVNEVKDITEKIYANDIIKIQELYYGQENNNIYINNAFQGINMVCKLKGNKEDFKKVKDEVSELLLAEFDGKFFPMYIEGNKLNIVFSINPSNYLKAFKKMYNNLFIEGNYSYIEQILELGEAINKINIVTLKIMDIVEK
jgi:hypothetical protein